MMALKRPQRLLTNMLTGIVLALILCGCSTQHTVVERKTILLAPPEDLLQVCTPERVKEDSVRALAHGYIVNTYEVWKCNSRIEGIQEWVRQQKEIYNEHSSTE